MTPEGNKDLVLRLQAGAWNYEKLASLDQFLNPDFVFHGPSRHIRGLTEFREAMAEELDVVADLFLSVEDVFAGGDRVGVRYIASFIPHGVFMGRFPDGRMVRMEGQTIHRLSGGKISETWHAYDRLKLVRDLGVFERLREDDEAEIRSVTARSLACGLGSVEDYAGLYYAPDAELVRHDGETLHGRTAIAAWLRSLPPQSSLELSHIEIDGAGDLAHCRGDYVVRSRHGDGSHEEKGKYLEVWRKQQDRSWKVVRRMEQAYVPVPVLV